MKLTGEIQGYLPPHLVLRVTQDTLLIEDWMYKGKLNPDGSFSIDLKASGFFDDQNTPF